MLATILENGFEKRRWLEAESQLGRCFVVEARHNYPRVAVRTLQEIGPREQNNKLNVMGVRRRSQRRCSDCWE